MVTTSKDTEDDALLDPKSMDGPTMKWAPSDVFKGNPRAYLTYHVASAGYSYMSLLGVTLGGVTSMIPAIKMRTFPKLTALQAAGTVGIGAGVGGIMLGLGTMYMMSQSEHPKIPFTDQGIQQRVDGLSHNFQVRVLDASVVGGLASAGGIMMVLGGPTSLGLSAGTLGVLQGLSLGSAVGTLSAVACVEANKDNLAPTSTAAIQ
jgi:hypothetical protein